MVQVRNPLTFSGTNVAADTRNNLGVDIGLIPTALQTGTAITATDGSLVLLHPLNASGHQVVTPPSSGRFGVMLASQSFSYYCYVADSGRFNRYWASRPGDVMTFRKVNSVWQFESTPFLQHWINLPESMRPTGLPIEFAYDLYPGPNAPTPAQKGWVTRGGVNSVTQQEKGARLEATAATTAAHTYGGLFRPKPSGDWQFLSRFIFTTSSRVHYAANPYAPFGGFATLNDAASDFSTYGKTSVNSYNARYPHQSLSRARVTAWNGGFSSGTDAAAGACEYNDFNYLEFTNLSNTVYPQLSNDGWDRLYNLGQLPSEGLNAHTTVDYIGFAVASYGNTSPAPVLEQIICPRTM